MDHVEKLSEALPTEMKDILHIEVTQLPNSVARRPEIEAQTRNFLSEREWTRGAVYTDFEQFAFLTSNVSAICICETDCSYSSDSCVINKSKFSLELHVFQLTCEGAASEELDEEEEISAANHWILPAREFHGMWENLIFDTDVKQQLLNYAQTTLLFSDKSVDANIISWNRVVLLHGPPGTGKTSLCKALAQKLSIRLSKRFRYGQLIEINSHSLFSKWFSESGKLVMKMFQRIEELITDPEALVFVLIDEVESLTAARSAAMSGSEPSDAIRVVNALLTQIDRIKTYSNVLILTTSNITGAVDLAFVDRADIKQYIGPPSEEAIFTIYHSCITELKKRHIIARSNLPDLPMLKMMGLQENKANSTSFRLLEVARKSYGLSGRTLRKLPFIAHAMFLHNCMVVTQEQFVQALSSAVDKQLLDREQLSKEEQKLQKKPPPVGKSEHHKTLNGHGQGDDMVITNGYH